MSRPMTAPARELNATPPRHRLALALAAAGLLALSAGPAASQTTAAPAAATASTAPAQAPELVKGLPDFTPLVELCSPAVVNIRTTERLKPAAVARIDPNIEEFMRRFGIPLPQAPKKNTPPGGATPAPDDDAEDDDNARRGVGSGFIISADGYVMTNAHVVEGADEVLVTLTDKREFKARIVGSDPRTDVAVVKIETAGLPFLRIGDVNRLKVGEWVIAIGSPYNLENTVTSGIVSAKQRDTGDLLPLIQTDVAINPGNSGGPLINMRGEVVGINSQILSPSGGFAGISLAIPIDEAQRVADQLRASGRVIRGRIGVQIAPVSKEIAESIGLGAKPYGALVQQVQPGLPAEKAGIVQGDVITLVDGRKVEKSTDLPRLVGQIKPGAKATLQVLHDGKFKDIKVDVIEFAADKPPAGEAAGAGGASADTPAPLGLKVGELSAAQKAELRVTHGVKVEAADQPGAKAGVREGDVILKVGNTEITGVKQFAATVAALDKSKAVALLVRRGEQATYLLVKPTK